MLTGNHAPENMSPYYHVAWDETPPSFTALVAAAGPREFTAEIFLHQAEAAGVSARLFRLEPGRYRLRLKSGDRTLLDREEEITASPHVLRLEVPGGTAVRLELTSGR
jgi:hypothetical protein